MTAPKRRATYDDLMQVPESEVAEIIDGELVVTPRPASPHAAAAGALFRALGPYDEASGEQRHRPGGWWILFEPELHLDDDVLVPDLAGWRRERMPRIPNVKGFTLAPDWVCEVVSPSTGRIDRSRKLGIYAREAVRHVWIVDPIAQTLEVYRLEDGRWIVAGAHGGDDVVRPEPFDAAELPLGRWWVVDTTND